MVWKPEIHPEKEPFRVLLKRGEFVDISRNGRVVPFKLYHPVDHELGQLPVIIWSHGFGGNRDGASFISRYLASHGYVIVHLTHIGTDSSLWEGKSGHPWDILREVQISREVTLNRFYDVPFALDQLHEWAENNPDVGQMMDFSRVGISGHSFGAMTTQVMAGQLFPDMNDNLVSLRDERFKAGILYSPVPIQHLTAEKPSAVYGPIAIPLLHMTGTDDQSPLEGYGYEHRLLVAEHAGHKKQYIQVLQGGDHMIYNGTRGKLVANPLRDQHESIIKISALAFWDAYLKDDKAAREWLENEMHQQYTP